MLAHLALTRDFKQRRRWLARMEEIQRAEAVDKARNPRTKALLANNAAWNQMRATGKLGASYGLLLGGTLWLSWLLPTYAVGHGFGWLAALTFLLPVPLAWKAGRRLWEKAALGGMQDLGNRPTFHRRLRTFARGILRSFGAGFGFGFSLVFLTCLITWFMTPAETIALELLIDARDGVFAGLISGGLSTLLAPFVSREAPELTSGSSNALSPIDD